MQMCVYIYIYIYVYIFIFLQAMGPVQGFYNLRN